MLRGTVRLVPQGDLLIASDLAGEGGRADHVAGVHRPSVTLSDLTVRRPVERALDMGTGCGIQALLAAGHAERVVATDVNERALAFTALNAALNGVENVELRAGSFFEPVAGERFGLVVSNPPYVISPEASFLFRDSGLGRDLRERAPRRRAPRVPRARRLRDDHRQLGRGGRAARPAARVARGLRLRRVALPHRHGGRARHRGGVEPRPRGRRGGLRRGGRPLARVLPRRGDRADRLRRVRSAAPRRRDLDPHARAPRPRPPRHVAPRPAAVRERRRARAARRRRGAARARSWRSSRARSSRRARGTTRTAGRRSGRSASPRGSRSSPSSTASRRPSSPRSTGHGRSATILGDLAAASDSPERLRESGLRVARELLELGFATVEPEAPRAA